MDGQVFKKDEAGIRRMLQSSECLEVMEQYAEHISNGEEIIPFIGYDRAKCFVKQEGS